MTSARVKAGASRWAWFPAGRGRYVLAVGVVAAAVAVRWATVPIFGYQTPYFTVYPAIVIIAMLWGTGAAVAASLVGFAATEILLIEPLGRLHVSAADLVRLAALFFPAVYLGHAGGRLRAALAHAEDQAGALRESEERLNRSQAIAHLGSWELDLVHDRLTWSDEVYRIFGLRPQEFAASYEAFLAAVHPEDRSAVDAAYSGSLREGRDTYEIEHRVVRRTTGEVRWVHEKCEHVRDAAGKIVRSIGMVLDITEGKAAEAARRESESRFRSLFSHMLDGFAYCRMLYDERGRPEDFIYLDVNEAFGRLLGVPENVVGKRVTEIFPTIRQTHPELFEIYGRVAASGRPERLELEFKPLGLWLSIAVYSPERGSFVAVFDNITERKRAESTQALATEVLRLLNRGGDLHFVIRETLRLIRESTGFDAVGLRIRQGDDCPYYEQDGFSDDFLREENFLCEKRGDGSIVRDADGRTTLECTCGLVLAGRTDPSMPCFTENGSFWTNVSSELLALTPEVDPRTNPRNRCIHIGYQSVGLFPMRSGEETIGLLQLNDRREGRFTPELIRFFESLAGSIGLALKRTQAEEELRKARDELELRVRERTAQLQDMVEELKRSNEDLERYAHISSHDLQEPVRMVGIYTGMLAHKYKDKLDAEANEYIDLAVEGAVRMSRLIKDLLEYSRVNTQGQKLQPTDAGAVLRRVLETLQLAIRETSAHVTVGDLPTVEADATQLGQVFQNLIENALKYHKDGEPPAIHVSAEKQDGHWLFKVRDNGLGIDPAYHEKIFVAFQRLHADRSKYPGTGIGLAIVKRIIERHHGRVGVDSKPGDGSTFYFTLPAKDDL